MRMEENSKVREADLEALLDDGRLGPFQILIIALCGVMAMIDGFDTQVIGLVAPSIAAAWHVPAPAFGPVFSLGLFGGLLGVLTLGTAGDRFGRKPVLLGSIFLFASVSLLTPFTHSLPQLIAVRVISGFGLGGALPGLIAVTSEYAPRKIRTNVTALMYCGFPLGSVLAGVVSAQLIPVYGWPSVFYLGSLVPLALLPVFALVVPESVRFLAIKGQKDKASRINPDARWSGAMATPRVHGGGSLAGLFADGRALGTLLLWLTLFMSLLLTVFLVSWVPLVAHAAGLGIKTAVLAVSAFNLGGILGCFLIGRITRVLGPTIPISLGYALGGVCVAVLGFASQSGSAFLLTAFVAGLFAVGAQMSAIGLVASFYDTSMRSTGVGWALGSGRVGAVVGPLIGGVLIGMGMPMPALFLVAGCVSLVAALAILGLGRASRRVQAQAAIDAAAA
jgi:AAHS family 4-hydroxybenzoate transporter-like MFS transporter